MQQAAAQGFEGIIAKRRQSKYQEGERSGDWQKWKAEQSGELLIGGYVPQGSVFSEIIVGHREGRKPLYVARTGAGFVPATRKALMIAMKESRQDACPFVNLPETTASRSQGQGACR